MEKMCIFAYKKTGSPFLKTPKQQYQMEMFIAIAVSLCLIALGFFLYRRHSMTSRPTEVPQAPAPAPVVTAPAPESCGQELAAVPSESPAETMPVEEAPLADEAPTEMEPAEEAPLADEAPTEIDSVEEAPLADEAPTEPEPVAEPTPAPEACAEATPEAATPEQTPFGPDIDEEDDKGVTQNEELIVSLHKILEQDKVFLRHDIHIDDVAKMLLTNRTYITRLMRQEYGLTFIEYVNVARIQYSQNLLYSSTPTTTLDEIAEKSGFLSTSNYCRAFKRYIGTSPLTWLQQVR